MVFLYHQYLLDQLSALDPQTVSAHAANYSHFSSWLNQAPRTLESDEDLQAVLLTYIKQVCAGTTAKTVPAKRLSSIGARLHQQKEMRDLFEDILDQVTDTFVEAAVPLPAVGRIFVGLAAQLRKVSEMSSLGDLRTTILCQSWTRFLAIVRLIVEKSYAHVA